MTRPNSISNTVRSGESQRRQITVMVVDDERDVRESVCEMLQARGYDVVCAEDGRVALERLHNGCLPDIILLDLMMPGMNGWQFREAQSGDPRFADIPVVVITATRHLREIKAEEVVHKPIRPEQLLRVVERWSVRDTRARAASVAVSRATEAPAPAPAAPAATKAVGVATGKPAGAEVSQTALFSDRFIEMLGHDLRNPLSAISITGGVLRHHATTPETAEPTGRILAIVDRMDLMIAHLLDFLRVCLGREMQLERRRIDLADVCNNVVRVFSPSAGREIQVVVDGEMTGVWDRDRIEMLLSTLMTDAFDHDRSGAAVRVHVDGSKPNVVKIEVAHGGITAVDLLSKTREARSSGKRGDVEEECTRLGLGMYVAQQIVMAHGGQMHTDSNDGAGTRFTIELPRDMEPAP